DQDGDDGDDDQQLDQGNPAAAVALRPTHAAPPAAPRQRSGTTTHPCGKPSRLTTPLTSGGRALRLEFRENETPAAGGWSRWFGSQGIRGITSRSPVGRCQTSNHGSASLNVHSTRRPGSLS